MELSPILAGLEQYPFARLDDWRADARRRGIDVIDFGVGDPREPTPAFIREAVSYGAGPRASQFLILAAKARAILDGRFAVSVDDVAALARPTLQHRLILNYRAEAEGLRAGEIVDRLLSVVTP